MTTIIGIIRKALPTFKFKRSEGRGMVWWYVANLDGDYLRGKRNNTSFINKMKKNFETWKRTIVTANGDTMTRYTFILRDKLGNLHGVVCMWEEKDRGACVLFDEIVLYNDTNLNEFHKWNGEKNNAHESNTYEKVSGK